MAQITKTEMVAVNKLKPYEKNSKTHSPEQVEKIADSIKEFGFISPCLIDKDLNLIAGHGRVEAAKLIGLSEVPCVFVEGLTEAQRRAYVIADNRLTELGGWDEETLQAELKDLEALNFDVSLTGFDFSTNTANSEENEEEKEKEAITNLREKYLIAPFSVLDTRTGDWHARKKDWNTIIKDIGSSRKNENLYGRDAFMRKVKDGRSFRKQQDQEAGTSILDPVLCEIIFNWFIPKEEEGRKCFDCFAGDTALGFVSSYLGGEFTGTELRQEQVDFNQSRVDEYNLPAKYICDDGQNIRKHIADNSQDLFFSCPPYFNLEVYSDMENDASNQGSYEDFIKIIDNAFTESGKCLKDNRFAVVVAGDIRKPNNGEYYDFPGDVKRIFKRNGFLLYNQLILVRVAGSNALFANASMRNRKTRNIHEEVMVFYKGDKDQIKDIYNQEFAPERDIIVTHEQVLVFYKGKPSKIKETFGEVKNKPIFPEDFEYQALEELLSQEQ